MVILKEPTGTTFCGHTTGPFTVSLFLITLFSFLQVCGVLFNGTGSPNDILLGNSTSARKKRSTSGNENSTFTLSTSQASCKAWDPLTDQWISLGTVVS